MKLKRAPCGSPAWSPDPILGGTQLEHARNSEELGDGREPYVVELRFSCRSQPEA
ncbi:MAG: hypothetical protein KGQ51_01730 [Planctomycetes bacterium]|nr:hypothetical protein [Planctomycetota bacterium]